MKQNSMKYEQQFGKQLINDFTAIFGETLEWRAEFDLIELVKKAKVFPQIYLTCGTNDFFYKDHLQFWPNLFVVFCGPVHWRLFIEFSGPARCEGPGERERVGAGRGSRLHCLHFCLHHCHFSCSEALHWVRLHWAGGSWPASEECKELLEAFFGEQISSPSSCVTALMTEALRR